MEPPDSLGNRVLDITLLTTDQVFAGVLVLLCLPIFVGAALAVIAWRRSRHHAGAPTGGQRAGLFALGVATAALVTVGVGFTLLATTSANYDAVLVGPAISLVVAIPLTVSPFWRWCGLGLLVGPVLTVLIGGAVIGPGIGS